MQPEGKELWTTYTPHTEILTKLSLVLHFGISDHNSILLIPTYKQKLKRETSLTRSIKKWSDDADAKLQDSLASTDWNMFWDSSDGIEEYTT